MSKFKFSAFNFTPTATADTTTMANGTYMAIAAGTATQRVLVGNTTISGLAPSTSSPTFLMLAYDSTNGATPTALAAPNSAGQMDRHGAVITTPPTCFVAATTGPQRSASTSLPRVNLGFNAYGGIIKFQPADREELVIFGTATSIGEVSLSAFTGGTVGAISAELTYEPA